MSFDEAQVKAVLQAEKFALQGEVERLDAELRDTKKILYKALAILRLVSDDWDRKSRPPIELLEADAEFQWFKRERGV